MDAPDSRLHPGVAAVGDRHGVLAFKPANTNRGVHLRIDVLETADDYIQALNAAYVGVGPRPGRHLDIQKPSLGGVVQWGGDPDLGHALGTDEEVDRPG